MNMTNLTGHQEEIDNPHILIKLTVHLRGDTLIKSFCGRFKNNRKLTKNGFPVNQKYQLTRQGNPGYNGTSLC